MTLEEIIAQTIQTIFEWLDALLEWFNIYLHDVKSFQNGTGNGGKSLLYMNIAVIVLGAFSVVGGCIYLTRSIFKGSWIKNLPWLCVPSAMFVLLWVLKNTQFSTPLF